MTTSPRRISSADGVTLAVYEAGNPDAPTVVAIHGYPDNHAVWDGVVQLLADTFHVVTYDVRGTGASDKPGSRDAYRYEQTVTVELSHTEDAQEAQRAFVEKRKPVWRGR